MAESIPAAEMNAAAGVLLSPSATGAVSSSIAAAGNHSAVSLLSPHAGALLDNRERMFGAVVKREELRHLELCPEDVSGV
ncbi:hypothetical protein BUALT_Bualt19G0093900 [Buddleja alternifolia]|uniref:Uncharacterized protein n=1 Tax=Buddleja alternifolia TaxID=168488 RepID=A0AAV6W0L6_9LAMI|nr:hypothetical protein BUALT_Bualt19G0093900 [Buddleja alternifolia]